MTSTIKDALASPAEGSRTRPAGLAGAVYAALGTVRDPELDEPITTLGFVASWKVSLVDHSGPIGSLSDRSYWTLFSNSCGSCEARYLSF